MGTVHVPVPPDASFLASYVPAGLGRLKEVSPKGRAWFTKSDVPLQTECLQSVCARCVCVFVITVVVCISVIHQRPHNTPNRSFVWLVAKTAVKTVCMGSKRRDRDAQHEPGSQKERVRSLLLLFLHSITGESSQSDRSMVLEASCFKNPATWDMTCEFLMGPAGPGEVEG